MQGQFDTRTLGALTTAARNPITGKICLGTTSGIIIQYDMEKDAVDARQLADLKGNPVNTISWSPNGIFVASAHRQGYVGVWHAASGKGVLIGQVDKTNCYALAWSRSGTFLVVPCVGKQELVVYPASEFTLGNLLESGQVLQLNKSETIFKWKGGKSNLAIGNFSPDDLHFAFTGGDTTVQVANTTSWEIEYKVKVTVRPTLMYWIANDRLLVSGPPEKGAKAGEDQLFLLEMPSGKVITSQMCPTILLVRIFEQEGRVFLLQEVGEHLRLGFRVLDPNTLQTVGDVTPNIPDICDLTFLPGGKKVCVITRTGIVVGNWNGKEGSNYEQAFSLSGLGQQATPKGQTPSPASATRATESGSGQKETLFGFKEIDIKTFVAISADGTRRIVVPGLDPEVAKKWATKFKKERFIFARTSLSEMGLTGEILQVSAVLKAVEGFFDLKEAVALLTGERGRLTDEDAQKFLYMLFKQGLLVMA